MTTGHRVVAAGLLAVGLAGCSSMGMDRDDLVATPDACGPKRFDVYFAENEAGLTDAARTAIASTTTQLQGCEIRSVRVLGLADATGAAAANQTLSERRALAVVEALAAQGWPAPAFEVGAAGDAGAITPGGVEEPLRRRAEVLVTATPR
ncbi:OmpA family protein [Brevundimonas aurifodinae]|uniref:OmpA family protein n=2 Tax=Brevundimonas TaxID=41275 RepID=A0ABV1NMC1_9CAUL|nr:MAG: flagellar motor protein MotB [Brevundimonas sp. 12-68-7]OYX34772.1 MAG: flagellar motor protein MotB [Brevundimonas subvibrioides]